MIMVKNLCSTINMLITNHNNYNNQSYVEKYLFEQKLKKRMFYSPNVSSIIRLINFLFIINDENSNHFFVAFYFIKFT